MANESIRIFEVGPRDGLQNEQRILSLQNKTVFIQDLVNAGVKDIELGAFVRPDRVPQMADTDQICQRVQTEKIRMGSARGWCLVPNRRGLERALSAGVTHISVFTAATESFAKKNIGMSIRESLVEFQQILRDAEAALGRKLHVRGYVSTVFGCPFEGRVSPRKALHVIEKLFALGVEQVSIGDTIGVATPKDVDAVIKPALKIMKSSHAAVHFHDTRGTALANTLRSMDLGIRIVDSSAGGLGGCPFAPGAAGNLATEDLVYMLSGMGVRCGIDLARLCRASLKLSRIMKRPLTSRYLQTFASKE